MKSFADWMMGQEPKQAPKLGSEEGEPCNRDGCAGVMGFGPVEGCTCFISPPCHRCVENPLVCRECGCGPEDD